ncbi:hypothetical protein CRYUN_Cryun05aG0159800 [Craigia yunnanensis]
MQQSSSFGCNRFELCLPYSYFLDNLFDKLFIVHLVYCLKGFKSLDTRDDEIDLSGDEGVIKKIITRAKAGALAPRTFLWLMVCTCGLTFHYDGALAETGEVFDTTHEDNSVFSFELGKGTVIHAWDIASRIQELKRSAAVLVSYSGGVGTSFLSYSLSLGVKSLAISTGLHKFDDV